MNETDAAIQRIIDLTGGTKQVSLYYWTDPPHWSVGVADPGWVVIGEMPAEYAAEDASLNKALAELARKIEAGERSWPPSDNENC